MDRDPIATIIGRLERPVAPSPAFADSLLRVLLKELEGRPATSLLKRAKAFRPSRPLIPATPTLRQIVLIAVGLALLAAAGAAAYYVSTNTWLSAGSRGVQFTNDFELVELFRAEPGVQYSHLTIGPDGKEIYAVRLQHLGSLGEPGGEELDLEKTGLVRIRGLQGEQTQTELLLKSGDLKDPALWDAGTDLSGTIFVDCCSPPEGKLSVASNGDLFFLATASSGTTFPEIVGNAPKGASLIVRHRDGTLRKVLTVDELVQAGLLPSEAANQRLESAVAASAPGRLWLLVQSPNVPIEAGGGASIFRGFYEVQDPNGDGDWSDRKIRPITLPSFVGADARTPEEILWYFSQLIAEPSGGSEDRSRSFLLQMQNRSREHHVYRVADHNGDGDAMDGGEFELVFAGSPAAADLGFWVAPRIVVRDGQVVLRELVVNSFTTATRISRITETGEVIDIARAFSFILNVLADPQGNIYVWGSPPDNAQTTVLYKLKPVPEGERLQPQAAETEPSPQPTSGTIASGVPQIAFTREVDEPSRREVLLIGVDGSGPARLLENEHVWGLSLSPGGSRILYLSDEEIPNEIFTYVSNADGSDARKISEQSVELVCWLSEDSVIKYYSEPGYTDYTTLLLHDLESGQETTILEDIGNVAWPPCSPERPQLAFASGLDISQQPYPVGDESLELFDLETASRRLLDGPLADRSYLDIRWSPDGQQLGYFVGAPSYKPRSAGASRNDLYVRDVLSGEARSVYQFEGDQYNFASFEWSPSGAWVLVKISRGGELSPEEQRTRGEDFSQAWEFVLVNVESGQARQIVSGQESLYATGWTPNRDEDAFTYVVNRVLYLETVDGNVRELARAAGDDCPFCLGSSFGWSPDGRYLGLWNVGGPGDPNAIAVLDVTTGEIETVVQVQEEGVTIWNPQWWR